MVMLSLQEEAERVSKWDSNYIKAEESAGLPRPQDVWDATNVVFLKVIVAVGSLGCGDFFAGYPHRHLPRRCTDDQDLRPVFLLRER